MIIKHGNPKKKVKKIWVRKCHKCKCVYTYDEDTNVAWLGYELPTPYLICPECKEYNRIPIFKKKYRGDSNV